MLSWEVPGSSPSVFKWTTHRSFLGHLNVRKINLKINRYRRKRPKVNASIFDSALSHTHRSDASEKKNKVKVLKSALARSRPNVILLICDDFGIGDFQVYNKNSKVPTPNIDRLGNEGESFWKSEINFNFSLSTCRLFLCFMTKNIVLKNYQILS